MAMPMVRSGEENGCSKETTSSFFRDVCMRIKLRTPRHGEIIDNQPIASFCQANLVGPEKSGGGLRLTVIVPCLVVVSPDMNLDILPAASEVFTHGLPQLDVKWQRALFSFDLSIYAPRTLLLSQKNYELAAPTSLCNVENQKKEDIPRGPSDLREIPFVVIANFAYS